MRCKTRPGPAGGWLGDQGGAVHDARAALAAGRGGHRAPRAGAVVRVHAAAGGARPQGEATPQMLPRLLDRRGWCVPMNAETFHLESLAWHEPIIYIYICSEA